MKEIMVSKSRCHRHSINLPKLFLSSFCERWSILVPFILYLTLVAITWTISLPLRSAVSRGIQPSIFIRRMAQRTGESLNDVGRHSEKEIDKEVGNQLIVRDDISEREPTKTLEDIFHKADSNKDNHLSPEELSNWINIKTQEHIHKAIVENYGMFTAIDVKPRNGMISWEEYHTYFLHKNGLDSDYIKNHNEKHRELNRSMKEAIMRDRAAWSEAAKTDVDHLTLDEFLAFRHPESSHATILALVDELFDKFDRDGDEVLTEDEFSTLRNDGEADDKDGLTFSQGEKERRREFREIIDRNSDGKATRQELLMYIDPKNPRHAKEEAETLMMLADSNHDGELSLSEILNKMDLFLGSKMVDTARSFHDEF